VFPVGLKAIYIVVSTINGKVKLNIPDGTQPGTVLRLKGKGVQKANGNNSGDQLVKVNVSLPKSTTEKQKDLLKQFREE
jgi:molecular chaperone DnaJ